jgi:hypothetical protein
MDLSTSQDSMNLTKKLDSQKVLKMKRMMNKNQKKNQHLLKKQPQLK